MKEIDKSFAKKKIIKRYLFFGLIICSLSLVSLLFDFSFSIGEFNLNLSIVFFSLGAGLVWYATIGQMNANDRNKIQAEKYIVRSQQKEDKE